MQSDFVTITVPEYQNILEVVYNVSTEEYSSFMPAQSIYNDIWCLEIMDSNNTEVYDIAHDKLPDFEKNQNARPVEQIEGRLRMKV